MKLQLSRAFLMPERCACCLRAADSHLESDFTKTVFLIIISIRRTARVNIPYCNECIKHVRNVAGWRILLESFLIWILAFFVSGLLWTAASALQSYPSLESVRSFLNAAGFLLPWMAGFGYCFRQFLSRGGSPGPGHIRRGPAVELTDFSDETLTLECHNAKFRALLKAAQSVPVVSTTAFDTVPAVPSTSVPRPVPAATTPAPPPVPTEVSNENVRRRLVTIPKDAKPERVLRFVAFKCEIDTDGVVATLPNGASRKLSWKDVQSLYLRRLPHDPPWERMLVMDLTPRAGPPIRVLATTAVNFRALPGGAATSHLENCRRLAAHVVEQHPDVVLDPETRSFVSGFGPCAALPGIEQFLRYDDQFPEAFG